MRARPKVRVHLTPYPDVRVVETIGADGSIVAAHGVDGESPALLAHRCFERRLDLRRLSALPHGAGVVDIETPIALDIVRAFS